MEHETYYVMMMDALDGELLAEDRIELESHLRACPRCRREWGALQAIDTLFRQTPALGPAAGFAQRTLARLPDKRYPVWLLSAIYLVLLLSGAIPLLVGVWAVNEFGPVISQPAVLRSVWQTITEIAGVLGTILGALLSSAGQLVAQQPALLGWLLVMVGVVFLWSGIYRHLVLAPMQQSIE